MKRAQRNRRTKTVGMAPVPTPVVLPMQKVSVSLAEIRFVPLDVASIDLRIAFEELQVSGEKSNIRVFDAENEVVVGEVVTSLFDDLGLATVVYTFVPALVSGSYYISSIGFDPSIKSKKGAWLGAFAEYELL